MSVLQAPERWAAPAATTLLWALAAASVVAWGLQLAAPADAPPPPAASAPPAAVDTSAVARLLGAQGPQASRPLPAASSRFVLLGVVADTDHQGAALIAVDGKPARPFRLGAKVAEGYVLQTLGARTAALGLSDQANAAITLELPQRPLAPNPPSSRFVAPALEPAASNPTQSPAQPVASPAMALPTLAVQPGTVPPAAPAPPEVTPPSGNSN